jgi:nitric oxide reductase subunit B
VVDPAVAQAFDHLSAYYADVFSKGRSDYAIQQGALSDPVKQRKMSAFLWWTAWAASTNRPGQNVTYTQNWPHEPLIGNQPTGGVVVWSVVSFALLLAGIGGMVWYFASQPRAEAHELLPQSDPLLGLRPTPSQRSTVKYFFVVAALWVVQVALGAITAHYGVEGSGFYGIPLDKILPYSVSRMWHLQIGIFWIATSWLATGLYVAPAVSGFEPKGQRLGVNALFGALILVVVGSLAGEWLSVQQKLGNLWFWLGTQGYEYVDLGRLWQILLFVGLVFWLWLMWRALRPALQKRDQSHALLTMFVISSIAIPLFYAAGLMYGQRSNLVTAEYWRWWVVHLWVEGFFRSFCDGGDRVSTHAPDGCCRSARDEGGFILDRDLPLRGESLAPSTISISQELPMSCWDSVQSLAPLKLCRWCSSASKPGSTSVRRALANSRYGWRPTKWPIYFFVAVAFWNFVGAGLFGFFINPPIALYYMQGLNTTPVHGHTALFGVYGMLGLGLMLFCLRALRPGKVWKNWPLSFAFWSINIGLALMVLLSLLPIGLAQAWASVEYGTWYARSAEFLHSGHMNQLRWLRMIGDTLFALGALVLGWFVLGLVTGHSYDKRGFVPEGGWEVVPEEVGVTQ